MPAAMIGNEREVFLSEFLQKVFTPHHRFSTGAITDSQGHLSGQTDIAVEYGFLPSFPMPAGNQRLLIAESVAVTIEVKSNVSTQWGEVRNTVRQLRTVERNFGNMIAFNVVAPPPVKIPCIVVGYTGYASWQAIQNRLETTPEDERPDCVLSIDSGAFFGGNLFAQGPGGLYALTLAVNACVSGVSHVQPDLVNYLT